jgi:hypothetical protein
MTSAAFRKRILEVPQFHDSIGEDERRALTRCSGHM